MNKQKLVLIIDDDRTNIFALQMALKSRGYRAISSQHAEEGIRLLQSDRNIDFVLMDMMMPEMDGYEALGIIRETPDINVPIIAVTAQAMPGDRERCLDAGAWDYVSKPIDIDKLVAVMQNVKKP